MNELLRPWKLATLAAGTGALIAGAYIFEAPDWDIGVSVLMAGVTYVTAPWSMRALLERQWRRLPAAALLAWLAVDGCYAAYWSLVDPAALAAMREANAPASLSLFMMCGLLWMPRMPLRSFWQAFRAMRRPAPGQHRSDPA